MSTEDNQRAEGSSEDSDSSKTLSILDEIFHSGLVLVSFLAPLVFLRGISDFANLPQSAFIQIGVVLLLLVWLIKGSVLNQCLILKSPLNLPVLAFVLWSLVTIFYAHNMHEGLLAWRPWAASALMFFLVSNDNYEKRRLVHLLAALVVSGFLCSLLGIAQHLLGFSWVPQIGAPAATFANRNMAAHFIVLTFPLAVVFVFNSKRRVAALMSGVAACLMIVFLLYTKTRAAWIALGVEILLFFVLLLMESIRGSNALRWSRNKSLAVGLTVVVLFVMVNVSPKGFKWRVGDLIRHIATVKDYGAESFSAQDNARKSIVLRRAMWLNTIEMIKDRPWLGLGLGNHKIFYPIYHREVEVDPMFGLTSQLRKVHNDFLQTFAELGVVGIVLLGWVGFAWVKVTMRLMSTGYDSDVRLLVIGITLGMSGLLVNALFSFPFQRAIPPFSFMILMGILGSFCAGDARQFRSIGRRWTILCACAVVLAGLIWTVRYQYLEIKCDRYLFHVAYLEKMKNWQGLIAEAEKAYRCNPARTEIFSYVGRAYTEMGRHPKAVKALQRVISAYPNHMNALLNLGIAYDRMGDDANALKAYKRALDIKPDYARIHSNMAHIYMRQEKLGKALDGLMTAAGLDPENSVTHYNIGVLEMRNGRYPEAARALERTVQLKPEWDLAHKNLGVVYLQFLNREEEGIEHLVKALKLNPEMKDADRIREMINTEDLS
jgi:O-antigen ligase/Flp pilus assembly protein TadD